MRNHAHETLILGGETVVQEKVISVVNYRSSRKIGNVKKLLEVAVLRGKLRPRGCELSQGEFRSLVVFDNGTCLLKGSTVAHAAKRVSGNGFLLEGER